MLYGRTWYLQGIDILGYPPIIDKTPSLIACIHWTCPQVYMANQCSLSRSSNSPPFTLSWPAIHQHPSRRWMTCPWLTLLPSCWISFPGFSWPLLQTMWSAWEFTPLRPSHGNGYPAASSIQPTVSIIWTSLSVDIQPFHSKGWYFCFFYKTLWYFPEMQYISHGSCGVRINTACVAAYHDVVV